MITMPLFAVCDKGPTVLSLRPLEIVLSTGLSLTMPEAGRLMQRCSVVQRKKQPTEWMGCPTHITGMSSSSGSSLGFLASGASHY